MQMRAPFRELPALCPVEPDDTFDMMPIRGRGSLAGIPNTAEVRSSHAAHYLLGCGM
jgi:hypothetical protein